MKISAKQKKLMLRMARRRIGSLSTLRKTAVVAEIRRRFSDAPQTDIYGTISWFIQKVSGAPLPPKPKKQLTERMPLPYEATDDFLRSPEWRVLRMKVITARGRRCECCGASSSDGVTVINVDHVKPRRKYPELALTESNLQILCDVCNHGKGNWDETDWRQPDVAPAAAVSLEPEVWWPSKPVKNALVVNTWRTVKQRAVTDMRPRLVKRAATSV